MADRTRYDLAIVGGGINGCGIARDAAGRGLSVFLCEQGDLGSGTSSASSKLIHGGLRYLQHYQFKLVRESLRERTILYQTARHLVTPLRFILPHHPRLRPRWLIYAGVLLYDLMAGKAVFPRSNYIQLKHHHTEAALKSEFTSGFAYSDCYADDSRLVITVAKHATRLGATISPRTKCESVAHCDGDWQLKLRGEDAAPIGIVRAKVLVNATGPWVDRFPAVTALPQAAKGNVKLRPAIKLVQGSHIVVKKWFDGAHAYILQNADRRVVFVIPFEKEFVIIGTTEVDYHGDPADAHITTAETDYLCDSVNEYFDLSLQAVNVIWSYSGVRPLYDDGAPGVTKRLREVSRDYFIELVAAANGPPMVTLYGGKLTTFRQLAERVVTKLSLYFPALKPVWSDTAAMPGATDPGEMMHTLTKSYAFLPRALVSRYTSAYGSDARALLAGVDSLKDLGECFGGSGGDALYRLEVDYLIRHEWARTAEDILWRRSKLGLRFERDQVAALERWMGERWVAVSEK